MADMAITPNEARSQQVFDSVKASRTNVAEELLAQNQSPEVKARLEKIAARSE